MEEVELGERKRFDDKRSPITKITMCRALVRLAPHYRCISFNFMSGAMVVSSGARDGGVLREPRNIRSCSDLALDGLVPGRIN